MRMGLGLSRSRRSSAPTPPPVDPEAWKEGATLMERWQADDPAALFADGAGTDPVFENAHIATGPASAGGYARSNVRVGAEKKVISVGLVYTGDPDNDTPITVALGPPSSWPGVGNDGLWINLSDISGVYSYDNGAAVFTPNDNDPIPVSIGTVLSGQHRRLWVDGINGKVWIGNDSGPASGDPEAGTGAHFTYTPGTIVELQVSLDQAGAIMTIERDFSSGSYAAVGPLARWVETAGFVPPLVDDMNDSVHFLAATYDADLPLIVGGVDPYSGGMLVENTTEGALMLVPGYKYAAWSTHPFEVPPAFFGLECDIAMRTLTGVQVGVHKFTHHNFPMHALQEAIIRYPSDPSKHESMKAFLEEHNTITYHDGFAFGYREDESNATLATWYAGYYGYGTYGVVTLGDTTVTLTTPSETVTVPPMTDGYYTYCGPNDIGDFADIDIEGGDLSALEISWFQTAFDLNRFIDDVPSTQTLIVVQPGFPPAASRWPAGIRCLGLHGMNFAGSAGGGICGRFEDLWNFNEAPCKDTIEYFLSGGNMMTGVIDPRPLTALKKFWGYGLYGVTELRFSGMTTLEGVWLYGIESSIEVIDFSGCTGMTLYGTSYSYAGNPNLRVYDVSGIPGLYAGNLTMTDSPVFTTFRAVGCDLHYMTFNNCEALEEVDIHDGTDSYGDSVLSCQAIAHTFTVDARNTKLKSAYFNSSPGLSSLLIDGSDTINILSLSGCAGLSSLDLTGCVALAGASGAIYADGCTSLASLTGLSDVANAGSIYFSQCPLTTIDYSGAAGTGANFAVSTGNPGSGCPNLHTLDCSGRNLLTLQITESPALKNLNLNGCSGNVATALSCGQLLTAMDANRVAGGLTGGTIDLRVAGGAKADASYNTQRSNLTGAGYTLLENP